MARSCSADFEILSRLGAGSFGTVYKVRRYADNEIYVIKNVRIMELTRRAQTEAINEVQILAQLKSPYVVRYYDSFIESDSLYIVMEYCNRKDLQNLLKRAQEQDVPGLKENVVWNICLQVILGLQYLHKKRILHRDLKTANVFLMKSESSPNYFVKIGDLGVAKLMDTSTAFAKTIVGTPYYLSPELCKDLPYRDKSDCWALGVLMFECCTLKRPFEAKNQCALIMKIIESPVEIPFEVDLSDGLRSLIMWLLQKDPDRRPSVRDILCEEFVRERLNENRFALPEELQEQPTTNFLREGFGKCGLVQRSRSMMGPKEEKVLEVEGAGPQLARKASSREPRQPSNKQLEVEADVPPKLGRLPSKRSGSNLAPSIRGDRVRGSNRRLLSEKALNRYQTASLPISSSHVSNAERNLSSSSIPLSRAESKVQEPSPRHGAKDQEEDRVEAQLIEEDILANSKSLTARNAGGAKAGFNGQREGYDEKAAFDGNGGDGENERDSFGEASTATWNISGTKRFNESNFTSSQQSFDFASAGSTTEISNLDLEGDSEFWNTLNMQRRQPAAMNLDMRAQQTLQTVTEVEELSSPTAKSSPSEDNNDDPEYELEMFAAHINEQREYVTSIMGEDLFNDIYDLIEMHMHDTTSPEDRKNKALLEDLNSIFEQQPQIDIPTACDIVSKMKMIVAFESKYDSPCDDEELESKSTKK